MNSDNTFAIAGPSNPRLPNLSMPVPSASTLAPHSPSLYLPPPGPPPPRQHLASTQDLLSRFQLLPAYDKYVRPFATQYGSDGQVRSTPAGSATSEKGKGKEVDMSLAAGQTPGGPGTGVVEGADGDDEDGANGKGERKPKNSYKALIKGIPGKHSLKKDDYLTNVMLVPPKQRMRIVPFDARTQHDAFTVSLEGLKGWNINTLILESAQAREDRKKRKELKRLAKQAQVAALQAGTTPTVAQPQPVRAYNGSATAPPKPATGTSTPRPAGTPRPISTVPRPGSMVPRPGSTAPRPNSTAPKQEGRPTLPPVQVPTGMISTPSRTATPTSATMMLDARGKKREREEGAATPVNGVHIADVHSNGNGVVNGVAKVSNVKAGVAGARPRPIKKQRMDMQGQARDVSVPVQQPTPQGV